MFMKTLARQAVSGNKLYWQARALLLSAALFLAGAVTLPAQTPDFTNNFYYGHPIMAWSFYDTTNWPSDGGYAPVAFTNLSASALGDGTALVVDSADPAWLQYNVTENSGTNNLTVDRGSVLLWFAPHWTGTNEGGTGPGTWGRLLEVGSGNSNGWWSLYFDPEGANLYFSSQTNGGDPFTYLSAPIDWGITNYWHQIVLAYSATNTALYVDDALASNGPGLTNFPGVEVLTNGFFIGSDATGNGQAHGMIDDLTTYNYPLSYSTIGIEYLTGMMYFQLNPLNAANYSSAPSTPSTTIYNVIAGYGNMTNLGASASCVTSSEVWLTNVAVSTTTQPMTFYFTIAGGTNGQMYDVFACPALTPTLTNGLWSWQGQGGSCTNYAITNLPTTGAVFFILGTAKDTDGDGLTDAYELLVSHTDPTKADTSGDGMQDGWKVLWGLSPLTDNSAQNSQRSNFGYTLTDWLNQVTGTHSESFSPDFEGNLGNVAQ